MEYINGHGTFVRVFCVRSVLERYVASSFINKERLKIDMRANF